MEVENLKEEIEQYCTTICGLKYFIDLVSLLKKYLHQTFRLLQSENLGITLADGGQIQFCLEKVLGGKGYRQLLNELIWYIKVFSREDRKEHKDGTCYLPLGTDSSPLYKSCISCRGARKEVALFSIF